MKKGCMTIWQQKCGFSFPKKSYNAHCLLQNLCEKKQLLRQAQSVRAHLKSQHLVKFYSPERSHKQLLYGWK